MQNEELRTAQAERIGEINERARREDALRDRVKLLSLIADNMTDYVTVFDLHMKVIYATPSFARLSGYTAEEISEVPLEGRMTQESYARVRKIIEEKLAPENLADPHCAILVETDIEYVSKYGVPDWFHCTYRLIRDAEGRPECFLEVGHKITERKQAEAALKESEEKYRSLFNQSVSAIYLHDLEGRFLDVNAVACAHTGHSREELLQMTVFDLHPADADAPKQDLLRQWSQWQPEQRHAIELVHRRKDGTVFPVDISTGVVCIAGKRFILALVSDVTERKRAEAALKESEERYKTIVASMSDMIFVIDEEDRFVDVHCPSPETLILPPEQFRGKETAAVMPPHLKELYQNSADHVRRSGKSRRFEYSLPIAGETRWFIASLDLHTDGRKLVAGVREITDRKRAEEALRQSESLHRLLADNSVDTISRHAPDGTALYVSPSCESLTGYTTEELTGRPAEFLLLPEDIEPVWNVIHSVPESEDRYMVEHRLPRKDGTIIWVETNGRLVRDAEGRLCEIQCSVRDITKRKQAEEALRRAHDELEQRVEERTADLSAANAQLRRERRTLEHMLRASDHERRLIAYDIHDGLAQELAGAIMQFQIYEMQKDAQPGDARKAFDGGMTLLRQGHSEARRLISGVRPPILDESGVVAAIAHLVHDPAFGQGPGVDFRSRVTFTRLEPVVENVIYRIVQEGLTNARKHSQSPRILVSIVERGDRLRLEVRDWGVGFDPRKVPEDRFGLEGIRERARLLGGKCRIRSKPGEGARVVVELPLTLPRDA